MINFFIKFSKGLLYCLLLSILPLAAQTAPDLLATYTNAHRYNDVCWLTTHNSFANAADGWVLYQQQMRSLQEQYIFGVRSFMLDLYWYQSTSGNEYIALCHEDPVPEDRSCPETYFARGLTMNPISLESYFEQIKTWLEKNDQDIITLHFESYLGKEGGAGIKALLKKTGLAKYLYRACEAFPEGDFFKTYRGRLLAKRWPTLGQMRAAGTRLVIFSSSIEDEMLSVDNYHENDFDLSRSPNCEPRRDRVVLAPRSGQLFMMNHFHKYSITVPLITETYSTINSYTRIVERVEKCYQQFQRWPNFIAVDFVEEGADGGAKAAVIQINTKKFKIGSQRDEL